MNVDNLNMHFCSTDCSYGDLKLADNGVPYIYMRGSFHPICGRYLWDAGDAGPSLFCKNLGYEKGK